MEQSHAAKRLDELGVVRWDTFPPNEGRIRFLTDAGTVAAWGRYEVVLGYGPGEVVTMAWSIGAYRAAEIPFVDRAQAGGDEGRVPASRQDAWAMGEKALAAVGAGFLYWCGDLLVIVRDLSEGPAPATDGEMPGPAKRQLYDRILAMGPNEKEKHNIVFVIEADEPSIEMCRDDVAAGDLPFYVQAYWMMPTWRQRTAMIQLVQDFGADTLRPLWLDILSAPDNGAGTGRHISKAIALAWLAGDRSQMLPYFDDYDRTRAEAARWLQRESSRED